MSSTLRLSSLVHVPELKAALKTREFTKIYRLVDANLGSKAKEEYDKGYIGNAVYMDTMHCVKPSQLYPRDIPEKKCFEEYVGSLGISNKHHLILYDRSPFGFYTSSRLWWLFRYFGHEKVSILNGGYNKYCFEGGELTKTPQKIKPEKFVINENKTLIRNFEQIVDNLNKKKEVVVDARGPDDFKGLTEIKPPLVQSGHILGAKNVPYGSVFDNSTGLLKSKNELKDLFKNVENENKPIVASCLTGMTACTLAFAAHVLGLNNVSMYYGSWTEYSQRASKEQCSTNS